MGQTTLVREQIDGGEKFIRRLAEKGVVITAACWSQTDTDGQPYLYLVVPAIQGADPRPTYLLGRLLLREMEPEWSHSLERIDPFDVKLVAPDEPVARGLLREYAADPAARPGWHPGSFLGPVLVDWAYLYPPSLFASPQPA